VHIDCEHVQVVANAPVSSSLRLVLRKQDRMCIEAIRRKRIEDFERRDATILLAHSVEIID
jgi:hypothetical protein